MNALRGRIWKSIGPLAGALLIAACSQVVSPLDAGAPSPVGSSPVLAKAVPDVVQQETFRKRDAEPGKRAAALLVTATQPSDGATDIDPASQIIVVFNRPVVPLTGIDEQAGLPEPLSIEPQVTGEGRWINTSVYAFQPAPALDGATLYTVTVDGVAALGGERLAEPNRQVVAAAAEALGALGDATAVPGLIQALDYQGDGWGHLARAQAALALGKISDRRAVLPLIGVLREEGERREAKGAAAAALGQIGDPRALEPLCLAARAARSESVMKALNHFNDPCALSTLGDLSRNENWHVRLAAVRALGENPRPESLPPLRAATKDKEGYVRATAQKLLEKRVKGNRGLALPLISVLSVLTIAVTWLFIRKRRSTTSGTDGPKNAPAESG